MLKKIVGMFALVALVALGACKAQASEVNTGIFPPELPLSPTYITTDWRPVSGMPGIHQKAHWKHVYVIGVLIDRMHLPLFDENGGSIRYCSPRMPMVESIIQGPGYCRPIFHELYTEPIPKDAFYGTPIELEPLANSVQ